MKKWIRILLIVLTVLSLFYIFSNSLKKASQVESTKRRVVQAVESVVETVTGKDVSLDRISGAVIAKIGHVLEFSAFALFFSLSVYLSCGDLDRDLFFCIIFACTFVALTDEHLQVLGNGRNSSVSDVLVDLAACILGYGIAYLVRTIVIWKGKKHERSVSGS